MKKILLAITLVLGVNQAIQPSFFSKAFQSVKAGLTPGNIVTYTVLPTLGTGMAYHFAGKDVASQLGGTQAQLAELMNQLNKKEHSWYDSLGTAGKVIGGTLAAYRLLQYSVGEFSSFMQILGLINSIKGGNQGSVSTEQRQQEQEQEQQAQGPRKLRPAVRRA